MDASSDGAVEGSVDVATFPVDASRDARCRYRDDDGDGHVASECGGDDCDDTDPNVHPGALDGVTMETVGPADEALLDLALEPRPEGAPVAHVCFRHDGLTYGRRSDGRWELEPVPAGAGGGGASCALALDGAGRVHVVHHVGGREGSVEHAVRGPDGWERGIVGVGRYPDVAIDGDGRVHVGLFGCEDGDCPVVYMMLEDGTWAAETVETGSGRPGVGSLAIDVDASGRAHLAYVTARASPSRQEIRYARRNDGDWTVESVAGAVDVCGPDAVDLAVTDEGRAHVVFGDVGTAPDAPLQHASRTSGEWVVEEVQDGGIFPSVALDGTQPAISHTQCYNCCCGEDCFVTERQLWLARTESGGWDGAIVERQPYRSASGPAGPSALAILGGEPYLAFLHTDESGHEVRYVYPAGDDVDHDCDGRP